MRYYKDLYIGESVKAKKDKIIRKLNKNDVLLGTYIVALPKSEKTQLEFYSAALLQQHMISKDDIFVVGIAGGYSEALVMVEQITREVYDNTNGCDIRGYLLAQENKKL